MTQNSNEIKILGITGGIASGKSFVAELCRRKKGYIIDADKISHEVILKDTPAYAEIAAAIEGSYITEDGQIDRGKLGAIVFADKEKLTLLEGIVHKHVGNHIMREIADIKASGRYRFIVIDAPLLIESGTDKLCDAVWVISALKDTRINRIIERNSLTKEQAEGRIKIQTDWDNIQNVGYVFISNDGSIQDLISKVYKNLSDFLEN